METLRKPFQGVVNIVRFNWSFYAMACSIFLLLVITGNYFNIIFVSVLGWLGFAAIVISLAASFYVYDVSDLYTLDWIQNNGTEKKVLNINAGFDETSLLLQKKFSSAEIIALDFYDPKKHTEASIRRARKTYPAFPDTSQIKTTDLKLPDEFADTVFVIFAAHEIRDENERLLFFKELHRVLKTDGQIYVTEHLRDVPNFLVYNIGCFHFYPKPSWLKIFRESHFIINKEIKLNPFVATFILAKNGNTL